MTESDLDPEFVRGNSSESDRDPGMNFRCQLYALSKDESECAVGLLRYLGMNSISEFRIEAACAFLINHESKPLESHFPVSKLWSIDLTELTVLIYKCSLASRTKSFGFQFE